MTVSAVFSIIEDLGLCRTRIMRMKSKTCLSYHYDPTPRIHIPIITNPSCFLLIDKKAHYLKANGSAYLVDTTKITSGGTVAKLSFNIIDDNFTMIEGEKLIHLKVNHGTNYFANGYRIDNLTYISDCSFIPDETMDKIYGSEIVILDALRSGKKHRSHYTLEEAIETAIKLNPKYPLIKSVCSFFKFAFRLYVFPLLAS